MRCANPAITFEELAGVYIGQRAETYPTFVIRYDEIAVIEADGRVTNYRKRIREKRPKYDAS